MATQEGDTPGSNLPTNELERISDLVQAVGRGEISVGEARGQVSGRARALFEQTMNNLGPERRAKLEMQREEGPPPETPDAPPPQEDRGSVLSDEFDEFRAPPGTGADETGRPAPQESQRALERIREASTGESVLSEEFDEFREPPEGGEQLAPTRFTGPRAFQEGFERGVTGPLKLFGLQAGEETPRHPVAGTVGEASGMLATFLPFFKAGRVATKGVGILRGLSTEAAEQFARRTVTGQAMTGAISGGAFEAGFAETPGGALKRGAIGAGIGAVFDPAAERFVAGLFAGKAAQARRAAQEATERATAEGRVIGAVKAGEDLQVSRVGVPSAELAIERELSPSKLLDHRQFDYVARQMADPETNLGQILGRLGVTHRPGGLSIVPAVEGPEKVIPALRNQLPEGTQFVTRRNDEGTFEMLIAEPEMRDRLVAKVGAAPRTKLVKKMQKRFMGEGSPVLTYEEMVRLVREDFEGEDAIDLVLGKKDEFGWESKLADYSYRFGDPVIRNSIDDEAFFQAERLVHEYTHHVSVSARVQHTGVAFEEGADDLDHIWNAMGFPADELQRIRNEMAEASQHWLARAELREGVVDDPNFALRRAAGQMNQVKPEYYHNDHELMARTVQLMFTNPERARQVAPNAVDRIATIIQEQSPKLREMLSREHANIERVILEEFGERSVFAGTPVADLIDDAARQQFKEDGVFPGLEVIHQGEGWDWVGKTGNRRMIPGTNVMKETHELRHPHTGETKEVLPTEFVRPTLPRLMRRTTEVQRAVDNTLDEGLRDFAAVGMRDPETGNIVKGAIHLENFARTDDLGRWVAMNRPQAITGVRGRRPLAGEIDDETARTVAGQLGFDGVLVNDNGTYRAIVANQDAVLEGEIAVRESVEEAVDGVVGGNVFELSFDNVMRGMLRRAGAQERELPYLMDVARERYSDRLKNVMDEEALRALNTSARGAGEVTENLEEAASRVNIEVNRINGEIQLVHRGNKEVLGTHLSEEEAWEYVSRAGAEQDGINLASRVPTEAMGQNGGGGGMPPRLREQAANYTTEDLKDQSLLSRLFGGGEILGATITAMENFAKTAEEAGLGKPFTDIVQPTQRAIEKVNRFVAGVKRAALGDRTYDDVIQEVAARADGFPKEEQHKIVDYIEFMTKDEIARPGGLLQRGLTEAEIQMANRIEDLGHAQNISRLMATRRLVGQLLESKTGFRETVESLQRREIGDELAQTLEDITRLADDTPDSRQGVYDALGLTDSEREVIDLINTARSADMDNMSLMAIGRYAGAPELPAQYENGRAFFADAQNMSEEQVEIAKLMEEALGDAFKRSGLDPRRQIGGYWPHMRKLSEQGFDSGDDFIREALPETTEWAHAHIRTGELDVYAKDPADVLKRYIRSLAMKKHFDPLMNQVGEALEHVKSRDGRVGRIMDEYVGELRGETHSSFGKIEKAIRSMSQALGFDPPEGIVEQTTNILTTLAYGATIPFRPSLTARNYFQPFQMITPRVGPKAFWQGVARANSDEGFEMARKAGAVPENIDPVHASTEVDMNQLTRGVSQRMDRLVRKGFDWYRSADQWGRAVAYHAQRARIERHIDDYMDGAINFDEFMTRIKAKTYRGPDQENFANLIAEGNIEEGKDYLGRVLARETLMRYGHANHPAGWNSIYGRLFGQFGSWPVQYKDFVTQGLTRGTTKDKAEWIAYHTAINLGTVQAGAAVGVNLWNWLSFPSLQYTGGPYADIALNLTQLTSGSDVEQSMAKRNLMFQIPTLNDSRSIFLPMSYSVGDLIKGAQTGGPEGVANAFGFDILQPDEEGPVGRMQDLF